jgi:hypothetical protein
MTSLQSHSLIKQVTLLNNHNHSQPLNTTTTANTITNTNMYDDASSIIDETNTTEEEFKK